MENRTKKSGPTLTTTLLLAGIAANALFVAAVSLGLIP